MTTNDQRQMTGEVPTNDQRPTTKVVVPIGATVDIVPAIEQSAIVARRVVRRADAEDTMDEIAQADTGEVNLPIGAVLLLGFAYANLWITDLVPGFDWVQETLPRVVLTLLALVYVGLVFAGGAAPSPTMVGRLRRWRTVIALGIITLNLLVPTALFIYDRLSFGPDPRNVIDWPLQIEAGSGLLWQGQSPYGTDYSTTEMQPWSERANFGSNPALRHAIHLPVNFIVGAVVLPLWNTATGWQDARVILLAAYIVVLFLAPRLGRRWEDGHALMIGLALNPLLADTFAIGLSDFLLLALIVGVVWSLQRDRPRLAAVLLGVAVATRQFSWLLVPLFLVAQWRAATVDHPLQRASWQHWRPALGAFIGRVWSLAVVSLALIVPFFAANPSGFYADVIAFGSGGIADAYPIGGSHTYGFSAIVLALGWVTSQNAQFPFTLVQLAITLPLMAYVVWAQWRSNTLGRMLLGYVLVLGGFVWTGRFMHTNYLGFLFALMLLACFVGPRRLDNA